MVQQGGTTRGSLANSLSELCLNPGVLVAGVPTVSLLSEFLLAIFFFPRPEANQWSGKFENNELPSRESTWTHML